VANKCGAGAGAGASAWRQGVVLGVVIRSSEVKVHGGAGLVLMPWCMCSDVLCSDVRYVLILMLVLVLVL